MTSTAASRTLAQIEAETHNRYPDRNVSTASIEAAAHFLPYYRTGQRIKVETTYGTGPDAETYTRTGTVSRTTGWGPALLLVHRSNAHGSSDLLGPDDRIVAVQHGRTYVPVA